VDVSSRLWLFNDATIWHLDAREQGASTPSKQVIHESPMARITGRHRPDRGTIGGSGADRDYRMSIDVKSGSGDAELLQRSAHWQMRSLDQPDDLQLIPRFPHLRSCFFEQAQFQGLLGNDLLQRPGFPA